MNEINITISAPDIDEFEITTIGAGTVAGEAIVLHLGNGKWAIIDSCMVGDKILPLYYLNKIGVDTNNVELIICTHWHTDHIQGLSTIINQCPNARFYIAKVGDKDTFLRYVLERNCNNEYPFRGRWKEFKNCLEVLANRKQRPRYAAIDTELYSDPLLNVHLKAVSPSDEMLDQFDKLLLKAFENKSEDIDPNMCCIALILSVANKNIILGADLECNRPNNTLEGCELKCKERKKIGWCNVLEDSVSFNSKESYEYIKIPHHSSITAFCPKKWDNYFNDNRIATSTVYVNNRGVSLPKKDMLDLYFSLCSEYYLTSPRAVVSKDKKGKTDIERLKGTIVEKVYIIPENIGIICSRYKSGMEGTWNTQLLGMALKVDSNFVNQYT